MSEEKKINSRVLLEVTMASVILFLIVPFLLVQLDRPNIQQYTGKIVQLNFIFRYYTPITVIYFEDGTVLDFETHISGLIIGKTYTITYAGTRYIGAI